MSYVAKEVPMKLDEKAFALASGIVWGVVVFVLTNIIMLRGGTGEHLSRLSQVYPGYAVSFVGSLIGLAWGFVSMFLAALLAAWLYNKFIGKPPSP